jgi:hypothetical protein
MSAVLPKVDTLSFCEICKNTWRVSLSTGVTITMIRCVVCLLLIFKKVYGLMNNSVFSKPTNTLFWYFISIVQLLHVSTYVCHHQGALFWLSCAYTKKRTPHHPDQTQIITRQCNQHYIDFTVGILKVLLTITIGCTESLTYVIQPYAHSCNSAGHIKEDSLMMTYLRRNMLEL